MLPLKVDCKGKLDRTVRVKISVIIVAKMLLIQTDHWLLESDLDLRTTKVYIISERPYKIRSCAILFKFSRRYYS